MSDKRFFADVDLPFHVWVREDDRWVLREAPQAPQHEAKVTAVAPALIAAQHAAAIDGRAVPRSGP